VFNAAPPLRLHARILRPIATVRLAVAAVQLVIGARRAGVEPALVGGTVAPVRPVPRLVNALKIRAVE